MTEEATRKKIDLSKDLDSVAVQLERAEMFQKLALSLVFLQLISLPTTALMDILDIELAPIISAKNSVWLGVISCAFTLIVIVSAFLFERRVIRIQHILDTASNELQKNLSKSDTVHQKIRKLTRKFSEVAHLPFVGIGKSYIYVLSSALISVWFVVVSFIAPAIESMEELGISWTFGSGKFAITRTPAELDEAINSQKVLDQLSQFSACLKEQNCTSKEQAEIARTLGLEGTAREIVTDSNSDADSFDANRWIVIFGADRTLPSAQYEISQASSIEHEFLLIQVDNWYRSVAVFETEEEAILARQRISEILGRADAYVRLLSQWCSNHEIVENSTPIIKCDASWR